MYTTTRTQTQKQCTHISGELIPAFVVAERQQEVAATRAGLETRAQALDEKEQGLLFLEVQLEETSVELERREIALGMSGRCSNRLVLPPWDTSCAGYFGRAVACNCCDIVCLGLKNGPETEAADKLAQL